MATRQFDTFAAGAPLATPTAGDSVLGIQDGATVRFPAANTPHASFLDSFKRADTAAGTLGAGWTLKGAYAGSYPLPAATTGQISSGLFVNPGGAVVYAIRLLRATPKSLQCRWSWRDAGAGTDFTTLAVILSPSANIIDTMLHITLVNNRLSIQKRIAGGAFVDLVAPLTINPSLSLTDTPHTITVHHQDQTVRVQIDDVVDIAITDASVPSIVGPYICVEHYTATTSVRYPAAISEVSAWL